MTRPSGRPRCVHASVQAARPVAEQGRGRSGGRSATFEKEGADERALERSASGGVPERRSGVEQRAFLENRDDVACPRYVDDDRLCRLHSIERDAVGFVDAFVP